MITESASLQKVKGTVLIIVALSLFVIMGMLGLAIDLGNAYVNKTRLQNGLDAMALSAATSLVNDRIGNAVADARNTFNSYGLSAINATNDIDVCFFNNYNNINANSPCDTPTPTSSSKFVRVAIKPNHLLSVATTFASVIGFSHTNIYASAVSGPIAYNNLCNLIPILGCAEMSDTTGTGTPVDPNCSNGNCYGYDVGENYTLKLTDWTDANIGSGNFGLLDVGSGGNAVCDAMARSVDCRVLGTTADSQTGNDAGPTACLNVRFDDYTHGRNSRYPPDTSPPDTDVEEYPSSAQNQFTTSYLITPTTAPSHPGVQGRRVVHIPLVDCADGKGHGSTPSLDIQAMGCFLITQKVIEGTSDPDKHKVFTEFIGAEDLDPATDDDLEGLCAIGAKLLPSSIASPFAPLRVVLFKDPVSGDA